MDLASFTQLGTAGAALLVLWFFAKMMLTQAVDERQRNDQRLDKRDDMMRQLEGDIRNKFSTQLLENTNSMIEHSKIMNKVVDVLYKLN